MILVDAERVTVRRPDRPLFEDLSVTVSTGDRLGVVGRNGAGKSTLLRILAGAGEPEEGVGAAGPGRAGRLPRPAPDAAAGHGAGARWVTGWEAAAILDRLGMGGAGRRRRRHALGRPGQAGGAGPGPARARSTCWCSTSPPTTSTSTPSPGWRTAWPASAGGLVLVTHDRHVLDRVTTRILELDRGSGYVHDGGYASYLDARSERAEREVGGRRRAPQPGPLRAGVAAPGRAGPHPQAQGPHRVGHRHRGGTGPGGPTPATSSWRAAGRGGTTPRLGDKVVDLHGVGHHFGATGARRGCSATSTSSSSPAGGSGSWAPTGRASRRSSTSWPAAGRRPRAGSPPPPPCGSGTTTRSAATSTSAQRVREAVAGSNGQPTWEQNRLMERFLFDADAQWAPIGTLSGGERRRLQLLLVLAGLPNVLLLDEPTNDLDLDTLRALEDYLEGWPGSLVVVSHDRALLERTVEDVLVLDGVGGARLAPGGYAEYEADRRRRREGGSPSRTPSDPPPAPAPIGPGGPDDRRPRPRAAGAGQAAVGQHPAPPGDDRRAGDGRGRRPPAPAWRPSCPPPPATTPPWPPRPTPWPRPRSPWPPPRTAGSPSPRSSGPSRTWRPPVARAVVSTPSVVEMPGGDRYPNRQPAATA